MHRTAPRRLFQTSSLALVRWFSLPLAALPLLALALVALPLLAMTMLTPARAGAAEVAPAALLNFTARRIDPQEVLAFSRNLREAFLLTGRFQVMDEVAMYGALVGPDGATKLKQARSLLADGKKAYRAKQWDSALKKLEAARSIHSGLYSELSRADELTDLFLFQGLTLLEKGNREAAQVAFLQMFLLDPTIDVARVPGLSPDGLAVIEAARARERETPLKGLKPAFASAVAGKLGVKHLVTGVLEAFEAPGGQRANLTLQIVAPGKPGPEATLIFELKDLEQGLPPAGAPVYQKIVGLAERVLTGG